jgi:osmotically-inducible protein OsmY
MSRILVKLFTIVVSLAALITLSGCAAALVGGGAAGGYTVAKNKGTIGQTTDDSVITSKVKAKYLADSKLKSLGINVSTTNNVTVLTGAVPTCHMKKRAYRIALHTKGVASVDASKLVNKNGVACAMPVVVKH